MSVGVSTIRIEADCLHEANRFLRKDHTKKTLVAFLGATSIVRPGKGAFIRSVYYFFRGIDDLLDGEYEGERITSDPRGYADDIKSQVINNGTVQPKDRITRLGNYAVPRLLKFADKDDDVCGSISDLIDEMVFDYDRRQTRAVSNAGRLKQNYAVGLGGSLDLLFVGLGSAIRTRDIALFPIAQGQLYAARDLEKDWRLGIINVPSEVLMGQADMTPKVPYAQLMANPSIVGWLHDEVTRGMINMEKSLELASDFSHRGRTFDMGPAVLIGLGNGILRASRTTLTSIS